MEGKFNYNLMAKQEPCSKCGFDGLYIPQYITIGDETKPFCPRCYDSEIVELSRTIFGS